MVRGRVNGVQEVHRGRTHHRLGCRGLSPNVEVPHAPARVRARVRVGVRGKGRGRGRGRGRV